MPSMEHESVVLLFRNRPELAPDLLRDALSVKLPAYTEARVESADLTELQPTEYRADLVILLVDGKPVLGIIVEVQLQRDERKRFTWPVYATNLRARLECPTCVFVVTADDAIATWSSTPIELGGGNTFTPFVIGASAIPVIVDIEVAKRDPELAVLSAMAHGKDKPEVAKQIATAAYEACRDLAGERGALYLDLIEVHLSDIVRPAFEALMASNYEYRGNFARTHRAAGEASALVTLLEARGIAITDEQKERILACVEHAVLEKWIRKAVTVTSTDELFED